MNVGELRQVLTGADESSDVLAFTVQGELHTVAEVDLDPPQHGAVLLRLEHRG